ncbi:hypothetical protein HDU67_002182 [Dinochytrium kinnereticum]|nr:hypothetical protein HDU67_002182 [Dinochytrium kinnereticum]
MAASLSASSSAQTEYSSSCRATQVEQCVTAAIRCLEAILLIPHTSYSHDRTPGGLMMKGESLSPRDEIKTRCKLAEILHHFSENQIEAEIHVQKALLLTAKLRVLTMQKIGDGDPLKYTVLSIHLTILRRSGNLSAAKYTLRQAISDTALRGIPQFYYYFISQKIEISLEEGDFPSAFSIMASAAQEAQNRNDITMMLSFHLRRASLALKLSDFQQAADSLNAVQHCFPSNSQEPKNVDDAVQSFSFVYYLVKTLYGVNVGNVTDARLSLIKLQEIVNPGNGSLGLGTQFDSHGLIRRLEIPRMLVLAFLMSALVWKPIDVEKSFLYLKEGLKNFYYNSTLSEVLERRHSYVETELIFSILLGEIKIMKGEFDLAINAFMSATQCLERARDIEKNYRKVILLDLGMTFQAIGDFSNSYRHLHAAEEMSNANEALRDFSSAVNSLMLQAGGADGLPSHVVDNFLSNHQLLSYNPILRESLLGVRAIRSSETQNTKIHFHEVMKQADKRSSQYKTVALIILGSLFMDTFPQQAKKMFSVANESASRQSFPLLAAFSCCALRDLAVREKMPDVAERYGLSMCSFLKSYDANASNAIEAASGCLLKREA